MNQQHQKKEWITVGALGDGFAPESFILPNSTNLAGQSFELNITNKQKYTYTFTEKMISWKNYHDQNYTCNYRASSVREGVYFIDFLHDNISFSTVLDLNNHVFTTVVGYFPSKQDYSESLYQRALSSKELTLIKTTLLQGTINIPYSANAPIHNETDELIGIRNLYRYSPTEVYEHIYLNKYFYTWHCLSGVEEGLCDTDKCQYYKLGHDLYLFIWREKIIPTLGIVIIDLAKHRSDGKICGFATGEFTALANFPVSSHCSLINKTTF